MKKLLYIRDCEEFWRVFSKERERSRRRLEKLPFAKKIEILSEMQKLFTRKKGQAALLGHMKAVVHRPKP